MFVPFPGLHDPVLIKAFLAVQKSVCVLELHHEMGPSAGTDAYEDDLYQLGGHHE